MIWIALTSRPGSLCHSRYCEGQRPSIHGQFLCLEPHLVIKPILFLGDRPEPWVQFTWVRWYKCLFSCNILHKLQSINCGLFSLQWLSNSSSTWSPDHMAWWPSWPPNRALSRASAVLPACVECSSSTAP